MNSPLQSHKKANDAPMCQINPRIDKALFARLCEHLRERATAEGKSERELVLELVAALVATFTQTNPQKGTAK